MTQKSTSSIFSTLPIWAWGLLVLMPLIPISGESLWFDEGTTSYFAGQETLDDVWYQLNTTTFSESQMPGYILYMWGWEKIFGNSEWALRMSNYPWLVLLLLGVARLPLDRPAKYTALALLVLSPFVWYNMDEARSTTAILSLGGLALCGLVSFFEGEAEQQRGGILLTLIACAVGLTFNMLFYFAVLPIGAYAVFMAIAQKRGFKEMLQAWWPAIVGLGLVGGGMLIYYIGTLLRGAGGVKEMPSVANLGFVLYEFLGFNGLGPSREAMKESLGADLIIGRLPYMIPMLAALGGLFWLVIRNQKLPKILTHPLLLSFILGLASFFVAALVVKFQFWGRHAVYLYPFFVLYLGHIISQLSQQDAKSTRLVAFASLALWGVSCLIVRFDPAYQKRGAREAIATAATHLSSTEVPIGWTTNWMVGYYYGLDFEETYLPYPDPVQEPSFRADNVPPFNAELTAEVLDRYPKVVLIWFKAFSGYDKGGIMAEYIGNRPHKTLSETRTYQILLLE